MKILLEDFAQFFFLQTLFVPCCHKHDLVVALMMAMIRKMVMMMVMMVMVLMMMMVMVRVVLLV